MTGTSREELKIDLGGRCVLEQLVEMINEKPSYRAVLQPVDVSGRCSEVDPVTDRDIESSGFMANLPYGDDPGYLAEFRRGGRARHPDRGV